MGSGSESRTPASVLWSTVSSESLRDLMRQRDAAISSAAAGETNAAAYATRGDGALSLDAVSMVQQARAAGDSHLDRAAALLSFRSSQSALRASETDKLRGGEHTPKPVYTPAATPPPTEPDEQEPAQSSVRTPAAQPRAPPALSSLPSTPEPSPKSTSARKMLDIIKGPALTFGAAAPEGSGDASAKGPTAAVSVPTPALPAAGAAPRRRLGATAPHPTPAVAAAPAALSSPAATVTPPADAAAKLAAIRARTAASSATRRAAAGGRAGTATAPPSLRKVPRSLQRQGGGSDQ